MEEVLVISAFTRVLLGGGVGEVVGSGLLAGLCKSKVDRMTSLFTSILV